MENSNLAYPIQDPHGNISDTWGFPQAACPPMDEDGTTKKACGSSKLGGNKKICPSGNHSLGSVGSSVGTWGQSFQSVGGGDEAGRVSALSYTPQDELTTIMMRNIPNNVTREQLLTLVNDEGFQGRYNLLYLPVDLKNKVGLGYAFVNFVSHEDAEAFSQHFRGYKNWNMQSDKVCEITWSDALQGLDEHVQRYRDCPVMHESIPDEFKPVLFKDGVRMPFPEPTKRIRAPRPWSRRH